MTRNSARIFLVAAEASGDQLGAGLIKELRQAEPNLDIHGIGGAAMKSAGVESEFDISPLAIIGFTEALKAYPIVRRKVKQAVAMIMAARPDVVVLIDSWGFMIRVAEKLKRAGFKGLIVKYVAPQVWAMREGRAKVLAKAVDHLLTIHSFDAPYFEKRGLPVSFVGNPMFDDKFEVGEAGTFRSNHNLSDDLICAVLFGSRPSEIERLYEPFAQTISEIKVVNPNVKFFTVLSNSVADLVREKSQQDDRLIGVQFLSEEDKYELFSASDVALAASGTITTQLAIMGVPTVVAYKLSPLTFLIAKHLFKPSHISLINISAGKTLMPEFVQGDCNAANLVPAMQRFIDDTKLRETTSIALKNQAAIMKGKGGPAFKRAASAIIDLLE